MSLIASYPPVDVTTLFVRVRTSSGRKRCLSSGSAIIAVQTMTTHPRTLHFRQVEICGGHPKVSLSSRFFVR